MHIVEHSGRSISQKLRSISRANAAICLVALVMLSIPKEMGVPVGLDGLSDHVAAYLGTMLIAKLGWPAVRTRSLVAGLIALSGVHQLGLVWVEGLASHGSHFAASGLGTLAGAALAHMPAFRLLTSASSKGEGRFFGVRREQSGSWRNQPGLPFGGAG